ncbi:MAG: RpiR family transcriptional regulator [Methylobacterium sp.]|nr:MAG: RpiR family transcriptional regulator [Methylobacterium sp.]
MKKMTSHTARPLDSFTGTALGKRVEHLHRNGSASQKQLADFILRNPIRVSAMTIEDLARATGISAPTISRFARELGFGGFSEMRNGVAGLVQILMDPVAKLREQLQGEQFKGEFGGGRSLEMLALVGRQIERIDAPGSAATIGRIAARLRAARHVHVLGFGLSAHVSALLVLGLQPFLASVTAVVEYGGTEVAAGRLMGIGPEDLLIAITFPRYASDVVRLAQYAKDRGAGIVVITDSPASPLMPLSDEVLMAPAEHPVLSSSMVAAIALAETLVAAVMLSDPENVEKAASLTQAIESYLLKDG